MEQKSIDVCNKIIVVINVIVFLVLDIKGDTTDGLFMLSYGAMYPDALLQEGEWYRIFSSMFLHFGMEHLCNNMIILFFLGANLERVLGHVKYLILYIISGLSGSMLSLYIMLGNQEYAVSAGASGAIFGVIGALLYVVLVNKGRLGELSAKNMIFMVVLSLYHGFTSSGVDNWAHIGGLVSGLVLAIILYKKGSHSERAICRD